MKREEQVAVKMGALWVATAAPLAVAVAAVVAMMVTAVMAGG